MAEPINFNKARKGLRKQQKSAQAEINRAKFGRNKAATKAEDLERARRERELDGNKRTDDPA